MKLMELIKEMDILFLKRRILLQRMANDSGLYVGQLPIIEYVAKHAGCSQVEIAETLHLSPASVAISTKRLQKAGIIEKVIDESNLRNKKLTITEKGLEMSQKCRELFNFLDRRLFNGFEEAELVQFKGYLDRLLANISDEEDKTGSMDYFEMIALRNQMINNKLCCKEGEDE